MRALRIALLQLLPGESPAEQLRIGDRACREAREMGADIALFPEMWSCGYRIPREREALLALAVPEDGEFLAAFAGLARELEMAIGVTCLERHDPAPRNSLFLFDRHGERLFRYSKVHTCDFGEERVLTPGEDFPVGSLDTALGPVKAGAMICYDREFPEAARILMLRGAELILVPNACPMELNRLCQLRARAFENMLAVATANYPAPHPDCNGHSSLFDGVPWLPEEPGIRDMEVLEAGEEAGIYLAELDLDRLRTHREQEVHGNAYRRPGMYAPLLEEQVEPPFLREDSRR